MGLGEIISEVLEELEGMVWFPWTSVIADLYGIIRRREKTEKHEAVGFWKKNFLSYSFNSFGYKIYSRGGHQIKKATKLGKKKTKEQISRLEIETPKNLKQQF